MQLTIFSKVAFLPIRLKKLLIIVYQFYETLVKTLLIVFLQSLTVNGTTIGRMKEVNIKPIFVVFKNTKLEVHL